jgi:hypothetical protein
MIEEKLSLPLVTWMLGQVVTEAKIDITSRGQIIAICMRGKSTQAIRIFDIPMPDPSPEGRNGLMLTAAGAGIGGSG